MLFKTTISNQISIKSLSDLRTVITTKKEKRGNPNGKRKKLIPRI